MPFRFDTIEIPTLGRPGHLFPPSAPPAEDDVRGSLTLVRAGRIFTFVSSSLIFTSLPRDRIYIRRIIIAAPWWNHENFPRTSVANEQGGTIVRSAVRKEGMNTKLIVFRTKCVHVCKPPFTTSCICTLESLSPACRLFHFVVFSHFPPPLMFLFSPPEQLSYLPSRDYFRRSTWKQ